MPQGYIQGVYPALTIVIAGTPKDDAYEYRVGLVRAQDFQNGFRRFDGSLNPRAARACFGDSPVYGSDIAAERAALKLYLESYERVRTSYLKRYAGKSLNPSDHYMGNAEAEASKHTGGGIKIMHFSLPWPKEM